MSEKHYNAGYLEDTAKILKGIKLNSYQHFSEIQSGTVIDLGCGTGADVANMAQLFERKFTMVGVDHDPALIDIARANTAGQEGIRFIVSEGSHLPFEDSSLNGVRAERLVQHLKEPKVVFDEIRRVLIPGSPVVIVESDWSSLCFYDEHVETARKITRYLTDDKINNGWASQKLISYFAGSGLENIRLNVYPFVLTKVQDAYTYLWIDKIIAEMADKNVIGQEEMQQFKESIEHADQRNCFACSMNIVIATAQKS